MLISLAGVAGSAVGPADRAAALASSGDLRAARHALAVEAPSSSSESPALQFVSVCLDLEESRLDSASSTLGRLRALAPRSPEVIILAHLVEERKRSPSDRWIDVAARAWRAAGRPMPGANPLLRELADGTASSRSTPRERDSSKRFLIEFAGSSDAELSRLVGDATDGLQSSSWRDAARLVATQVLLRGGSSKRGVARALDAVSRLSQAHPEDGYLAASAVLLGTDGPQPLSPSELTALEHALGRAEFGLPIRSLFVAFRDAHLPRLPAASAAARAFSAAIGALPLQTHVLLSRRAAATTEPAARTRAALVLLRAGSRSSDGRAPSSG
jgi:hypothetical protein